MRLPLLAFLLFPTFASAAPPAVSAVAYSADGKWLAAGTRGVVHLIDTVSGQVVGELPGQTQRVTALAVSRVGVLAVASGEPGKIGKLRLYLVADPRKPPEKPFVDADAHKDSIHALAFNTDGTTLASGSYDRTVKLWPLDKGQAKLTLTDHSDSVYAVAFSPDGKLLATGAADRAVKVWDTATGKRLYTLGDSTDWVYAVAWSADGKHLAAGGVDKSIRTWKADADGGELTHAAFAHQAAVTKLLFAADSKTLFSIGDDKVVKSWDVTKLTEKATLPAQPETILSAALRPDGQQLVVGRFDGVLQLVDPATGKAAFTPLPAKEKVKEKPKTRFPAIAEPANSDSARTAAKIALPVTVLGAIDRAGDVDYFRFDATAGQQVGIQLQPADPKKLDAVLTISDADGKVIAESANGLLGFVAPKAGTYAVGVADREFRGGPGFEYTLNVGELPVVTSVFPLGVQRGKTTTVHLDGVNLEPGKTAIKIVLPADAQLGERVPVVIPTMNGHLPLGMASVVVGEFPSAVATNDGADIRVPGTADGILAKPGDSQTIRFKATKGQKLIVEVHAARLGSPLDSAIEIQDANGKPLPRAVLRSVAQTYVTFRDHDADKPGIRLEAWNELRTNDYLYVDTELVRIKALPKNPDDDCQFVQAGGKRVGFLGTTPTHHAMNTPMYKVEAHPPGSAFPPNGLPVFQLAYRNDDGGEGFGSDSMLEFEAPADGMYQVKVADARGAGGPRYGYRLTVRPPRPDFTLSVSPMNPAVWRNGGVPLTVTAKRIDGFIGPINVKFDGLAAPCSAPSTMIEAEQTSATVTMFATDAKSASGAKAGPFKAVGTATIADKPVTREASAGTPTVRDPGDLTTTTNLSEVTVKPGGETRLTVKIERLGDFKGRVPLDVRGLPHGVKVLNIGLNGILILPGQTEREVVIYCEPWVQPTEMPIVVLSRSERKNSEHAAKSVLLKVLK